MACIHNLIVTGTSEATELVAEPQDLVAPYSESVGFGSNSILTLHAIVSDRDIDEEFETILKEVQSNCAQGSGGSYVTVLPRQVTDPIAELSADREEEVAAAWSAHEPDLACHESLTPEIMLATLIEAAQAAKDSNSFVAFHSFDPTAADYLDPKTEVRIDQAAGFIADTVVSTVLPFSDVLGGDSPPPRNLFLRLLRSWKSVGAGVMALFLGVLGTVAVEHSSLGDQHQVTQIAAQLAEAPFEKRNDELNKRVVHVSGPAEGGELQDNAFPVQVEAFVLRREARIWHWRKPLFGDHECDWQETAIDSSEFDEQFQNRGELPADWQDRVWTKQPLRFGDYELTDDMISHIDFEEPLALDDKLLTAFQEKDPAWELRDGSLYLPLPNEDAEPALEGKPQVGDIKVNYYVTIADQLSVIAQQNGEFLQPIQKQPGADDEPVRRIDDGIAWIRRGQVDAATMLGNATKEAHVSRLVRGFLLFLVCGGVAACAVPFQDDPHNMPLLGRWFSWGFRRTTFAVAFAISLFSHAFVYWFFDQQFAVLLAAGGLALLVLVHIASGKKANDALNDAESAETLTEIPG